MRSAIPFVLVALLACRTSRQAHPPHSHPVDEHITVVQGTWYFTVGEQWDRSLLRPLHVGAYAFAAKGSTMFGYCPDGAVVGVFKGPRDYLEGESRH